MTNLLRDALTPLKTKEGITVMPEEQVLFTLAYVEGSSFMRVVGDFLGFRKSSVS